MRPQPRSSIPLLMLVLAAACSKPAPKETTEARVGTDPIGQDPAGPGWRKADPGAQLLAMPSVAQNTDDPRYFVPLRSQPVKDAIYRALRSGKTQRWQDGKLSGYAVPSQTTAANGCRAVRYTVDQRPEVPFESINACSVSG
jgi:hypothetical protein